jgi:hypothetical protein
LQLYFSFLHTTDADLRGKAKNVRLGKIINETKRSRLDRPPQFEVVDVKTGLNSNFKVNRYPNLQNLGNLWYNHHSMRLTNYNVANGLAGLYILRDT